LVDVPVSIGNGTQTTGRVITFDDLPDGLEHVVVALGSYRRPIDGVPLVRVHSECLTGDVFGSRRCDCGPQLEESMARISAVGGYLVYLRQEGRGIGLYAKLDAYRLQDGGMDTFEANRALGFGDDDRDYHVAAMMLLALGVARLDLITGNQQKVADLNDAGVVVRSVLPTGLHQTAENIRYLDAKRARGFRFARLDEEYSITSTTKSAAALAPRRAP
jgi:GTP cyclohydrolase II